MIIVVSKYLVPKGFRAMAVFPFLLLRDASDRDDAVMLQHERIHFRQQLELLIVIFYLWYVLEFLFRWILLKDWKKAYRNISFEREAYDNESDSGYLKRRSVWKFASYL